MSTAQLPIDEQDRLNNLYSYELLDTLPEKDYDDITKMASYICDTPVSLVTLVASDRQWFKSAYGIDIRQTSREHAFCSHTILKPEEIMVVNNAEKDERFFDNPLVTGEHRIIFYAGVPLLTEEGYAIGSLCVLDHKPKELNASQLEALKALANQTVRLMQLHKKTKELSYSRQLLVEINRELETFAQVAVENLKKPCNNAIEFTEMIGERFGSALDADGMQLLSLIRYSCESIKTTVDNTLEQARRISTLQDSKQLFTFASLMHELKQQLQSSAASIVLASHSENDTIYFFKNLLLQILTNIIMASSQFNDKPEPIIEIGYKQNRQHYIFTIKDNGNGTPVFLRGGVFVLLQTADIEHQDDYIAHLNEIKQMIEAVAGSLEMSFEEKQGTVFTVSVAK